MYVYNRSVRLKKFSVFWCVIERIEELKRLMAEEKIEYLRLKREKEEVDNHKADDRLTEMWQEIEE